MEYLAKFFLASFIITIIISIINGNCCVSNDNLRYIARIDDENKRSNKRALQARNKMMAVSEAKQIAMSNVNNGASATAGLWLEL